MKISGFIFSALLLIGLSGCDDTVIKNYSNSGVPNNYFNEVATVQGTIFNAISGDRITDSSLKVTLVRGTTYQAAAVRTGTQSFAGDYAFTGVPISIDNNVEYRVSASVTGYQPFEAYLSLGTDNGNNDTLDKNYNSIENIYLFPLGATANDLKVNVTFDGEPVTGATVLLQIESDTNNEITETINRLFPDQGLLGSLMRTTNATGVVTFEGAGLVLGGGYRIQVLPVVHEGIQLKRSGGTFVIIGTDDTNSATTATVVSNIVMDEAVPGNDNGLYVVSATNTDATNIAADGVLTIVFSRAVSLVQESVIIAGLTKTGASGTAALDVSGSPNTEVTAEMTDSFTLTITPNFATATPAVPVLSDGSNAATADNGLTVTYSNLEVRIEQTNDTAIIYDVFTALSDETGGNPSGIVKITPSF